MNFFSAPFLPLVLVGAIIHRLLPSRYRWFLLLVMSLGFYATQGVYALSVLVGMLLVNICSVHWGLAKHRAGASLLVAVNLVVLFSFKYIPWLFGSTTLNASIGLVFEDIALPLGISFYTFQLIAYVVDSYRAGEPLLAPHHAASYVAFFPQLVAGPILRAERDGSQFVAPHPAVSRWPVALTRILWGVFKKRVVADSLVMLVRAGFESAGDLTTIQSLTAILAYTLQLYLDFSAYADIAIGLGELFGIRLPENFDRPYLSCSLREFWTRWHITLSSWLRDYLYIPLGGNRLSTPRASLNILITMGLGGLWHGAGWTYLIWGLWHGIWILIERFIQRFGLRIPRWIRGVATFTIVAIGWTFFRAASVNQAFLVLTGIFRFTSVAHLPDLYSFGKVVALLILVLVLEAARAKQRLLQAHPLVLGVLAGGLAASIWFASATALEFIYWRF